MNSDKTMTKEEILKHKLLATGDSNIKKNVGDRWGQFNREVSTKAIYDAMSDYAQQMSIGFAEYVSMNGWYFNKIKRWSNRNENSHSLTEVLSTTKTTEELYKLYLSQIK
jgi:hypothetical protein